MIFLVTNNYEFNKFMNGIPQFGQKITTQFVSPEIQLPWAIAHASPCLNTALILISFNYIIWQLTQDGVPPKQKAVRMKKASEEERQEFAALFEGSDDAEDDDNDMK